MKNLTIICITLSFFLFLNFVSVKTVCSDVTDKDFKISSEEVISIRNFEKETRKTLQSANSLIGKKELGKAKEQLENAFASVKEKISVYENNAKVLVSKGEENGAKIYHQAASSLNKIGIQISESLQKIEALKKEYEAQKLREQSAQYTTKGFDYLKSGNLNEAEESFKKAINIFSDNRKAQDGLARVAQARSRLNARRVSELLSKARGNIRSGSFDLAQRQLKEVLELDPGNRNAQSFLKDLEEAKKAEEYKNLIAGVDKKIEEGKVQIAAGKFTEAEKTLRIAISLLPQKEQSKKRQIESLIASIPALKEKAAEEKLQEQIVYHTTKGFQYLRSDKLDEAEKSFKEALKMAPNDRKAQDGLARVAQARSRLNARRVSELLSKARGNIRSGSLDLAQRQLKEVLELDPGNRNAQSFLKDLEEAKKAEEYKNLIATVDQKIEKAKNNLNLGRFEEAENGLEEALALLPSGEGKKSKEVNALLDSIPGLKREYLAKLTFKKVENIVTSAKQQLEEDKLTRLLAEGKRGLLDNNFEEAKEKFEEALKIRPKNELVLKYLDETEQAQKEYKKRQAVDRVIIEGKKYMEAERLDKAKALFQKALKMSPPEDKRNEIQSLLAAVDETRQSIYDRELRQRADEFINKGIDSFKKERYSYAKADFEKALAIKPDYSRAKEWLNRLEETQRETKEQELQSALEEGKKYLRDNKFDVAEETFARALEKEPQHPQLLYYLDSVDKARVEHQREQQLEKLNAIIDNGMKLLRDGQFNKAESAFKEAVDTAPVDMQGQIVQTIENKVKLFVQENRAREVADRYVSKGIEYINNNELEKAEEAFSAAIDVLPGCEEAKKYLQKLELARLKEQNILLVEKIDDILTPDRQSKQNNLLEESINQLIGQITDKVAESEKTLGKRGN